MGFKPRSSQAAFSIPLAELEQRLSAMGLSSAARELILC